MGRGDVYSEREEYEQALDHYNEAIGLDSTNARAYVGRGNAYNYDGKEQYDKAIADCNEAIRFNPFYALAYFNRGVAYENKDDDFQARLDYEKVLELDNDSYATQLARQNLEDLER